MSTGTPDGGGLGCLLELLLTPEFHRGEFSYVGSVTELLSFSRKTSDCQVPLFSADVFPILDDRAKSVGLLSPRRSMGTVLYL